MTDGTPSPGSSWRRAFSSGDILAVTRHQTPTACSRRRPFDSAGAPEELLNSPRTLARADCSPWSTSSGNFHPDPAGRITRTHFKTRTFDLSQAADPSSPAVAKDRALDYWRVGDSMRIMHHLEPKRYRAVSLHGQVFKGEYRHDWNDISHIQHLRGKVPAYNPREDLVGKVPYPQGPTQAELLKNRCFGRSHGTSRFPGGLLQVGKQSFIP
mmetsp:Transcript_35578/g.80350  ORF Transcript_35578/g.80350 Transcript_35578/m.80350 type:complete len:212 (-) Transcript_35578:167-802(-)